MAEISEQVSEMSAELLLRAVGELTQIAYYGASFAHDANVVARTTLVGLINGLGNKRTNKAVKELEKEGINCGSEVRQVTVSKQDLPLLEKWLKDQGVLYVAVSSKSNEQLESASKEKKSMVLFLERDTKAVANATTMVAAKKGLLNEIPPQIFLFLNKKKNIAVIDGLDVYELEVFRELAQKFGLTYSSMVNGIDQDTGEVYGDKPDSFKILASKKDEVKLAAIMQQMSWSMSGEYKDGIKEKVKERLSIRFEIQELLLKGVPEGQQFIVNKDNVKTAIPNAKYIVNAKNPGQYIMLTHDGFTHFNRNKEKEFVSKDTPGYSDKLQNILGDFSDAVVFDAAEWEVENLSQPNLRNGIVNKKLSVFPLMHNLEKENKDLRKAQKKHKESKPFEESAWLFHRYDTEKAFSEVIEANYNPSEPLEEIVSVHFGDTIKHSEKYKYIDVSNDEKTIDNIILSASERSLGNDAFEKNIEKEAIL